MHYGSSNATDAASAEFMGYSESNEFVLSAASVPAHKSGDTISFWVQAFDTAGQGANEVAKAEELNAGKHLGSEWSASSTVTFK